jgi:hypothetical protein
MSTHRNAGRGIDRARRAGGRMTLGVFLEDHRTDLIERTRAKVASRSSPAPDMAVLEHGVPLFLSQLSATLEEQGSGGTSGSRASAHPAIRESAALHGRDLLKFGFTIEQVVHDYGDVCQAVTELAEERGVNLSVAEFHTLNRCLDNAIASAVSSWNEERDRTRADKTDEATGHLMRDLSKLLDQAKTTFDVIREGRVAAGGATGSLLNRALVEMRTLIDRAAAK